MVQGAAANRAAGTSNRAKLVLACFVVATLAFKAGQQSNSVRGLIRAYSPGPVSLPAEAEDRSVKGKDSSTTSDVSTTLPPQQRDFEQIALRKGTDKVRGPADLPLCLKDSDKCRKPEAVEPKCRTGANHFYHTLYQPKLGPLFSTDETEPFQFLEIGFYNGKGFDAYSEFMPRGEAHSMEISCIPEGPRDEGKWPWGNFASKNPRYQQLLDAHRLHCGDASDYDFLHKIWTMEMKRKDSPPLKLVIDDGAHLAQHMAMTLFFWFPRLEPGGLLVVEDIQPIQDANDFRLHILPQVMKDLHYCGDGEVDDRQCFPTIQPLLQSIHCEMHICMFERNDRPATLDISKEESLVPPHAFDAEKCLLNKWED